MLFGRSLMEQSWRRGGGCRKSPIIIISSNLPKDAGQSSTPVRTPTQHEKVNKVNQLKSVGETPPAS